MPTYKRKYSDKPYKVKVSKKIYYTQEREVHLNPSTPTHNLNFQLVRKPGVWKDKSRTEKIPVTRKTVEDKNVRPDDSAVTRQGSVGEQTYYWQEEYIDGEFTGETRNHSNQVTTPMVQEIYTKGTAHVMWVEQVERTEWLPFTTVRQPDSNMYEGETRTEQGYEGRKDYIQSYEFMNGSKTGRSRNPRSEVIYPAKNTIIYYGTKKRSILGTAYGSESGRWFQTWEEQPSADTPYIVSANVDTSQVTDNVYRHGIYGKDLLCPASDLPAGAFGGELYSSTYDRGLSIGDDMGTLKYRLYVEEMEIVGNILSFLPVKGLMFYYQPWITRPDPDKFYLIEFIGGTNISKYASFYAYGSGMPSGLYDSKDYGDSYNNKIIEKGSNLMASGYDEGLSYNTSTTYPSYTLHVYELRGA
ncbi:MULTISPECIES: G5 domain-containing protein [Aerococcus]|uniref:G5 domain-containing protein n=1 Tax=Aerococcus TaxID=1375 RepID=UPI0008A64609|nr:MULTISPECIES: G5 domain-containing protein [Aerococcus]KAA9292912.1 hypothetical protein F6I06_02680 [Aerococcus mictus]MBU5610436.1 G5 domain-containing protein [Aerococcus urinae]MDK8387829.1 G5 domain-containing protein [Aerococcus urinae]MDK8840857.1 G5 domain-containing protein [Aerococcus urinae]OFM54367.1 hypothetical protein HMPREF2680_02575 [Aerococcus mictus]